MPSFSVRKTRSLASACVLLASCSGSTIIDPVTRDQPATSSSSAGGGSGSGAAGASSVASSASGTGGNGAGGGTDASGIISISPQSDLEAETHVIALPNGWVVVTWIALSMGGKSTNGYRFSKDGGATWEPVSQLASPNNLVASDPVLAADAQGNVYLTWIGFQFDSNQQPYDMHVYAAVAPAGSTTFGAPTEVSAGGASDQYDKPWITITKQNAVLATYAHTSSGGIIAARSVDQGKTWANAIIVEDGGFRNLVYPCVEPQTGRMFVTYHAGGGIGLRWSDDDGVTWPDTNKTAVADSNEPTPAFDDPTCIASANEVWVSYGLSNDPFSETDSAKLDTIRIAHSSDSGVSIDWRAAAQDGTSAKYFLHPQLARELGGALDLVYYAGNQEGDPAGSFRHGRSTDGGKTWAASDVVKTPIVFEQSRQTKLWLGDYVGIALESTMVMTSYTDNSLGISHVGFRAVVAVRAP